jgi:hypothetical protein
LGILFVIVIIISVGAYQIGFSHKVHELPILKNICQFAVVFPIAKFAVVFRLGKIPRQYPFFLKQKKKNKNELI